MRLLAVEWDHKSPLLLSSALLGMVEFNKYSLIFNLNFSNQ